MPEFEFKRAWGQGAMSVTLGEEQIEVASGKTVRAMRYDAIGTVRWVQTSSPQRTDYALILEGGDDDKLVINCNTLADAHDQDIFNQAVAAILSALSRVKPDLAVQSGAGLGASWLVFVCFAIPAFLGLSFAAIVFGEPGAERYVFVPGLIGALSAWKAWTARPWQRRETIPVGELAQMFSSPAAV